MKDWKKLQIRKTVESIDGFKALEHFVSIRGGNVVSVTTKSHGMEALYEI